MALTSLDRVTDLIPNYSGADNGVLSSILDATSSVIEKACNRVFQETAYDELYTGSGRPYLYLNNYPIVSIDRIMSVPVNILIARNIDQTNSRASIRLDADSLNLTSVKSGVTTDHAIDRSTTPTFADLATAVNSFSANGWSATALNPWQTWSVADLRAPQGGFDAIRSTPYLLFHWLQMFNFDQSPETGEIVSPLGFIRSYNFYRVVYTAGYPVVPECIQHAAAELSVMVYLGRRRNPFLQSETIGQYSYTNMAQVSLNLLSPVSRQAISLYTSHRIGRNNPLGP